MSQVSTRQCSLGPGIQHLGAQQGKRIEMLPNLYGQSLRYFKWGKKKPKANINFIFVWACGGISSFLSFCLFFFNLHLPLDHILLILDRWKESRLKAAVILCLLSKSLFFLFSYNNSQVKDVGIPKAHLAFLSIGEGNWSDFRRITSFRNISKLA